MDIKMFKAKKVFKKREHQPNPDFFWKIIFYTASLLVAAALVFGAYLFIKINIENLSLEIDTDEQINKVSKDRVNKALEYFTVRENKSIDIINFPSPVIDPS